MAALPIVVIGASAGGVAAVSHIVRDLPPDFPAAVFVAMHFPVYGKSVLPQILSRAGSLPASHGTDGEPITAGRIYVAPPDRHLLVHRDVVRVVRGPEEHGNRPALDPMFQSAAVFHGPRVIGVVLTGNLADGSAGLLSVKRHGGASIVQDPSDAAFPSMPAAALEHAAADLALPLNSIGPKLVELARDVVRLDPKTTLPEAQLRDEARREYAYVEMSLSTIEDSEARDNASAATKR